MCFPRNHLPNNQILVTDRIPSSGPVRLSRRQVRSPSRLPMSGSTDLLGFCGSLRGVAARSGFGDPLAFLQLLDVARQFLGLEHLMVSSGQRLRLWQPFRLVHLGQRRDTAGCNWSLGSRRVRTAPGLARRRSPPRSGLAQLAFRGCKLGVAVRLALGEHVPGDHNELPRGGDDRDVRPRFLANVRKNAPRGPG